MKRFFVTGITLIGLSACYTAPDIAPPPEISGNYVLDPEHASVIWTISHVGLSNFTARFDDISGDLAFDAENPQNSRIDIRIDPTSVNTGLPEFDETLAFKSQYFDANNHPDIRFVSTAIEITGKQSGLMTGDLLFRGQSHPVILDVTFNGAGKSFGHPGETLGFSAIGELDRTIWGLTTLKNFGIGEIVTLRIETEFNEVR